MITHHNINTFLTYSQYARKRIPVNMLIHSHPEEAMDTNFESMNKSRNNQQA